MRIISMKKIEDYDNKKKIMSGQKKIMERTYSTVILVKCFEKKIDETW